jgi:hypothetical protein
VQALLVQGGDEGGPLIEYVFRGLMKNICIIISLVLLIQYMPAYGFENRTDNSASFSNKIEINKLDTVANIVPTEDSLEVRQTNLEKEELRKEKRNAWIGFAVVGGIILITLSLGYIAHELGGHSN